MRTKNQSRRKAGARRYADYSLEMLNVAVELVKKKVISSYEAERQFGIPRRTIVNKAKNAHNNAIGRPTELSVEEEAHIADVVNLSAEFGCPLGLLDLRIVVHNYLQKCGKIHLFKGKMPGERWARDFISRHNFSQRVTQNIKRSRAAKSLEEMNDFYKNLEVSLKDVPPSNILNFDETNLSDDPGSKKCIFKRGTKHPERIMNTSKSAVSIMFSVCADGTCLPPYIVYKSEHLWSRWCENGPKNARYNRTKSGWFDMTCFEDWFKTTVLPWANAKEGVKVIIGDNLASHLSVETIQLCQKENIRFVFLPKNATHLTQPLDVSFFGPMKRQWRQILTNYKSSYCGSTTINKCHFPQLLQELMTKIDITKENNVCKGFEASGIYPLNPLRVTLKIPSVQDENLHKFDANLLEYLQQSRKSISIKSGKNNKLTVVPGKSISTEEAEEIAKLKNSKKNKTKQRKKKDAMPGPSKIRTVKKKQSKHAHDETDKLTEDLSLPYDDHKLIKESVSVDVPAQMDSRLLLLKNPESLCMLSINAINKILLYSTCNPNIYVQSLKDFRRDCEMNTPFYQVLPECLQIRKNNTPVNDSSPNPNQKPKIIITSNILIKAASTEKTVSQNTKTQRKRICSTTQKQFTKTKNYKKSHYNSDDSDSSLTSSSFHAADDSDYEDFDNYISSCLKEPADNYYDPGQEKENICPFGLSDINFFDHNYPKYQEQSWIIVQFTTKKSVKHFIGQIIIINDNIPTVKFTRKVKNSKKTVFIYPLIEDVCAVPNMADIVAMLPDPQVSRRGHFIFNVDLHKYNIQ